MIKEYLKLLQQGAKTRAEADMMAGMGGVGFGVFKEMMETANEIERIGRREKPQKKRGPRDAAG